MRFKSARVAGEWQEGNLAPLLKQIVLVAAGRARERWDWEFFLTCIYRTPQENDALYGGKGTHLDGVHVEWRGVDVRTFGVDPAAVLDITTAVNDRWQYDPMREGMVVALLEGAGSLGGSSGPHLHLQVSPATMERAQLAQAQPSAPESPGPITGG